MNRKMTKFGAAAVVASLVVALYGPQAGAAEGNNSAANASISAYKTDMQLAYDKGAIVGYPQSTDLKELQEVTRAELVSMINRAAQLADVQLKTSPFSDLSAWQQQAVFNAFAAGIVRGNENGDFQPNRLVTREELAVIVVGALTGGQKPEVNEKVLNYYQDQDQISDWARPYVAYAILAGIFEPKINGTFDPKAPVTRGHAAKALKPVLFDVLDVLTTNDIHGNVEVGFDNNRKAARGGIETIGGIVNDFRSVNSNGVVVLDGGDAWQGTLISNTVTGDVVIDAMEQIGYDAMAIGNHEFDFGLDVLKYNIEKSPFPIISANILETATQQPVDWTKPYTMIERGGLKIGIIGLSTPDTAVSTKSTNIAGLTFANPTPFAIDWATELRAQGADLVFANTHLPGSQGSTTKVITDELADLANETGGDVLDVIVGGHSHKPVAGLVNGVSVVEAYADTTAVGHVQLFVDKDTKKIASSQVRLLETYTNLTNPDLAVRAIVENYKEAVAVKAQEVEGIAGEKLIRKSYRFDINGNVDRDGTTPLGDLITDAMRAMEGSDIAFTNIGGIRADIEAGEMTYEKMFTVLPFGNYNVTGTMTAEQVKTALEVLDKYTGFPAMQFSGLMVEWDHNRPEGDKFTKITLVDGTPVYVDGQFADRTFSVTTNDFMSTGAGDGYRVFGEVTDWKDGEEMLESWVQYTLKLKAAGQEIFAPNDGRDIRLDLINN